MDNYCNIDIKPYDKSSSNEQVTSPFGISYLNQDYWGFKNRMLEYIQQHKSSEFNDFTESSIVVMLIELWAFLADTLSFKIDQVGNELFADTVTELKNAIRLSKFVGFKPTPPIPAKAMFSGTINNIYSEDLVISTPVKILYNVPGVGPRNMELFPADINNNPIFNEDIIIPAGSLHTTSVVGIEGTTRTTSYTSEGKPYITLKLNGDNILNGSINIVIDNTVWKEVDCFSNEESNLEYIVEYDDKYNATVIFGDNKGGKIPPKGSIINVSYRQGGGTAGNIVSGSIETTVRINGSMPHIVVVTFKNYTRGEGGYNGDKIEDIRRKLPLYLKIQNRCVTADDYKSLAELYSSPYNGSVGKAIATLRNSGCSGNIIDLYILANLGNGILTKPSDALIEKVANEIDKKKMLTDYVCVRSGNIMNVDITIDVIVSSIHKKNEMSIKDKILRRMQRFFSLSNWDFGKSLKESDIIRCLTDVKEVEEANITFTTIESLEKGESSTNVINVNFNSIIMPDNLVIYFNYK